MKFKDIQQIHSAARLNRYLKATGEDKRKAVLLYKKNIELCQRFFGLMNLFEVMLRNAIHKHYSAHFNDAEWILHQTATGHLLHNDRDIIHAAEALFRKKGIYNADRMVSAFTMGFWTYMFTKQEYRLGGKTLLQIFPNRDKGTTQKIVYQDLTRIREFRNRIAHHEPIIFDTAHKVNLAYATEIYSTIQRYVSFMGYDPEYVFKMAERPDEIMNQIAIQQMSVLEENTNRKLLK